MVEAGFVSEKTSIAACWSDGMNEAGLAEWARGLRARLPAKEVSLGLVFLSPKFFPHAEQVLEILRLHARIPLLAGCSGGGLVANAEEYEGAGGLVLALYALPGAKLKGVRFTQEQVAGADGENFWPGETGVARDQVNGWLAFLDSFQFDGERWLRSWNQNYPAVPVYGGLAGGHPGAPRAQLYLDGEVFEDGGVAVAVGGDVALAGVISQGCTPIGEAWTLTRVEQNLIRNIANRPAYAVLTETVQNLPPEEQRKAQGNLHIGLVVTEYLEDVHRGDFLVRNLLGGAPLGLFPLAAAQAVQHRLVGADAGVAADELQLADRHVEHGLVGVFQVQKLLQRRRAIGVFLAHVHVDEAPVAANAMRAVHHRVADGQFAQVLDQGLDIADLFLLAPPPCRRHC